MAEISPQWLHLSTLFIISPCPPYPETFHDEPHRRTGPLRSRGTLAALHGEPPVQGQPAPARESERYALLDGRRAADSRRGGGAVVRERRARPARDHPGRREPAGDARLRADVPDGAPARVSTRQRAGEDCPGRARSRVLHQLRIG